MAADNSPTQDGGRRLGNRWNSEEAIMDPIRLLQELEREAHEKRRGNRRAQAVTELPADEPVTKISNGPYVLLDDMAANGDRTPLLKETSTLNGPGGRRKAQNKSLPARKKPPNAKEKTGVGGKAANTLPVNRHGKVGGKSGKSTVKPMEVNSMKVVFDVKKALTPVPEENKRDEREAHLEFKVQEQADLPVQEADTRIAPLVDIPDTTADAKPKEKTSVLSRMRDAAKKINVAPSKLQQTVLNAKLLQSKLSLSKSQHHQDSTAQLGDTGSGLQPEQKSDGVLPPDFRFSESPDSFLEEPSEKETGPDKTEEGAKTEAEDGTAKPQEQEKPKGATWTGTSTNPELALKILNMSRRGDWLGVDALLKHVEKGDLPADLADEVSGLLESGFHMRTARVAVARSFPS